MWHKIKNILWWANDCWVSTEYEIRPWISTYDFCYTWAEQCVNLKKWTYCLEVWWASWFCCEAYASGRWGGYSVWCITLTSPQTAYVYVWWHPTWQTWWWNGWGNWYSSYWMWWWWWTDIRMWWKTLCNRVIVAWWSWGNNCTIANCYAQWWAWGWACWMQWYSNTASSGWANRDWWWGTQTSWWVAWSSGWSAWTFWQWWTSCSWYNAWGWGWGWYGWGWAYDNDSDNDWRWWGWGSWYTWTASTCSSNPAPACLSWIPYLTGAACCPWCVSFPSPDWWTETWHFWHWYVRITKI